MQMNFPQQNLFGVLKKHNFKSFHFFRLFISENFKFFFQEKIQNLENELKTKKEINKRLTTRIQELEAIISRSKYFVFLSKIN